MLLHPEHVCHIIILRWRVCQCEHLHDSVTLGIKAALNNDVMLPFRVAESDTTEADIILAYDKLTAFDISAQLRLYFLSLVKYRGVDGRLRNKYHFADSDRLMRRIIFSDACACKYSRYRRDSLSIYTHKGDVHFSSTAIAGECVEQVAQVPVRETEEIG